MKLLYKDQLRKIKLNLFNFISLSLLVIIISLTYTAVQSSIRRLDENYDSYLTEQNIEDFYFNMGEIDIRYLGGTATVSLCRELDLMEECGIAISLNDPIVYNNLNILINDQIQENPSTYETLVDRQVQLFLEDNDFETEKSYVVDLLEDGFVYKFMNVTESINIPYIVEGTIPDEDFEISIFPEFAEINSISIGDTYIIKDKEYTVTAFHYAPEFLYPIFSLETISFDPATQTLILTTENTVRDLNLHIFTKYLIDGDLTTLIEDFGYDTIQSSDLGFLGEHLQMVNLLMPSNINFRIISLEKEITNANAFINIFLPLFVGFTTLLLVIFMKRYIDKNQDDIKTLHALGYKNSEIARALLIYPFLISLTSIIGYLLGLLISSQLFNLYSARYLFPKADFIFYKDLLIYSIVLPIVIITSLTYIFTLHNLNKKKKTIKKINLRLFRFIPTKTVVTSFVLFTTISIMITFGLNGNSMFSAFVDTTKLGNNYEAMINLRYMTNSDHLDTYEEYTFTGTKITQVNSKALKKIKYSTVYGINPDNKLKLLIENNPDKNSLVNDGIIISDYLHTALNLKVGDSITFELSGLEVTDKIVGISNELIENNFFISKTKLNSYYDLDNSYYNGLYVTDNSYESPYILATIDYQNSLDEFSAILNISSMILNFLLVLSVALSLFIFGLIIINYFNDNRGNIAILKSVGYNNFEINKKYLVVIYLLLMFSYIISIPISQFLLNYMLEILMNSVGFKLVLDISIINIIIGFIVLNCIFTFIIIFTNKYYDKINISEILKHNIK